MNLNDYQELAARTLAELPLEGAALGLCGEAGEVGDLIKKVAYHGHELDDAELTKELGDVLWYLAAIANIRGLSLNQIGEANIAKLKARYPNGFNSADSINREQ